MTHREDQLFAAFGTALVLAGIVAAAIIVLW
jgi:hypothetical protein